MKTINKMKDGLLNGRKYCNYMTNKGLIFKICSWFIQLNIKKIHNLIENMGRRSEQIFFQREHAEGQ